MHIINLIDVGTNFKYKWPADKENYDHFIDYRALSENGKHSIRIGFCKRLTYSKKRIRVVVWIDEHPHAEFLGADDFNKTGEVLSEIKVPGDTGERICRYPDEPIPGRYTMFNTMGLPVRVNAKGVHNAWAVVSNIADHKSMISLAALRRLERNR